MIVYFLHVKYIHICMEYISNSDVFINVALYRSIFHAYGIGQCSFKTSQKSALHFGKGGHLRFPSFALKFSRGCFFCSASSKVHNFASPLDYNYNIYVQFHIQNCYMIPYHVRGIGMGRGIFPKTTHNGSLNFNFLIIFIEH